MHDSDGAGCKVAQCSIEAFLGCPSGVEIACQYIPHYNFTAHRNRPGLSASHSSVGRTEKTAPCNFFAFKKTPQVLKVARCPTRLVPHGVIAPAVPFLPNPVKYRRVLFNVVSYTEKSGFVPCFTKHVKDAGRPLRMRTIVKSQKHIFRSLLTCPPEFRK